MFAYEVKSDFDLLLFCRQIQQDEESKKILGTESSVNSAEVIEDSQLQLTLPNKPTSNSVEQVSDSCESLGCFGKFLLWCHCAVVRYIKIESLLFHIGRSLSK